MTRTPLIYALGLVCLMITGCHHSYYHVGPGDWVDPYGGCVDYCPPGHGHARSHKEARQLKHFYRDLDKLNRRYGHLAGGLGGGCNCQSGACGTSPCGPAGCPVMTDSMPMADYGGSYVDSGYMSDGMVYDGMQMEGMPMAGMPMEGMSYDGMPMQGGMSMGDSYCPNCQYQNGIPIEGMPMETYEGSEPQPMPEADSNSSANSYFAPPLHPMPTPAQNVQQSGNVQQMQYMRQQPANWQYGQPQQQRPTSGMMVPQHVRPQHQPAQYYAR